MADAEELKSVISPPLSVLGGFARMRRVEGMGRGEEVTGGE